MAIRIGFSRFYSISCQTLWSLQILAGQSLFEWRFWTTKRSALNLTEEAQNFLQYRCQLSLKFLTNFQSQSKKTRSFPTRASLSCPKTCWKIPSKYKNMTTWSIEPSQKNTWRRSWLKVKTLTTKTLSSMIKLNVLSPDKKNSWISRSVWSIVESAFLKKD